jgi:reactive intermediate/imine deaminase
MMKTVRALLTLSLVIFLTMATHAQTQFVNPFEIKPPGYTHVVITGNTVYISGQVPVDAQGKIVGKGDLRTQTVQVFENIKKLLEQSGATYAQVVKVNTYIVNCKPADVAVVREVRKAYFSEKTPPASTMVGVTSLVDPEFLIEIEVVAVIP